MDEDSNGILEKIYDVSEGKVVMDEKIFEEVKPWHLIETPDSWLSFLLDK
jgi:hypothetical protein